MPEIILRPAVVAVVDDADAWLLDRYTYRPNGGYLCRVGGEGEKRTCYLHRDVLNPLAGEHVDHINGIRHDCRRSNLRIASPAQNARNTGSRHGSKSRFKNVVDLWTPSQIAKRPLERRWAARVRIDGKTRHIGCFQTEVEAALAADEVSRREFGEFARLNFPEHEAAKKAAA